MSAVAFFWRAFSRWVLKAGALMARVASGQRVAATSDSPTKALVGGIERATRTSIGIDFGEPLGKRHGRITTAGMTPGVVRDKNPLPKGRGARRRAAARKKGGKK